MEQRRSNFANLTVSMTSWQSICTMSLTSMSLVRWWSQDSSVTAPCWKSDGQTGMRLEIICTSRSQCCLSQGHLIKSVPRPWKLSCPCDHSLPRLLPGRAIKKKKIKFATCQTLVITHFFFLLLLPHLSIGWSCYICRSVTLAKSAFSLGLSRSPMAFLSFPRTIHVMNIWTWWRLGNDSTLS